MYNKVNNFFSAMDISTTGLITQRYRMNIAAENLANIESTRTANGSPYRRKQVIIGTVGDYRPFLDVLMGARAPSASSILGGTRVVDVVEDPTPFRRVHKPGHPDADQDGYVLMPNINAVLEMADILSAARAYEANITAFSAVKSMVSKALDLIR
jgi:flagellar basal-body rod protein FlgC